MMAATRVILLWKLPFFRAVMVGAICVGAAVAKAIARCFHALCTGVALARMQDGNTQQFNEEELRTRAAMGMVFSSGAAPFAVVSVAACGVMVLSTAVVGGYCM